MRRTSRNLRFVGIFAAAIALVTAVALTAIGTTRSATGFKLMIGKPTTVPAQPTAGKPFALAFKVTRSDTNAPVRTGTMICDPAVTGKVITHSESFKSGSARLSFVVPTSAAGKTLTVHLTIKAFAKSAHTVATFKIGTGVIPTLSIADASVTEGNIGTTLIALPVTLSSPASQVIKVSYSTADGTATAPGDYASASGTVTFNPGERTKSIVVSVAGDTAYEPDETFAVNLTNAVNANLARSSATGTIRNDDPVPPPAKPGHYAGSYSDGDFINFDVFSLGTTTGNFYFQNNGHCTRGGRGYGTLTGHNGADGPYAIRSDGSFDGTDSYTAGDGSGGSASVSVNISGKFAPDGAATGNLSVSVDFTSGQWSGISCSSNGTWSAHVQ